MQRNLDRFLIMKLLLIAQYYLKYSEQPQKDHYLFQKNDSSQNFSKKV